MNSKIPAIGFSATNLVSIANLLPFTVFKIEAIQKDKVYLSYLHTGVKRISYVTLLDFKRDFELMEVFFDSREYYYRREIPSILQAQLTVAGYLYPDT